MAWSSTVIPIHAPREGCDPGGRACTGLLTDFNPRTPRGVRRPGAGRLHHQMPISIHAPREGCDGIGVPAGHDPLLHFNPRTPRGVRLGPQMILTRPPVFQSTHPARGATSWAELDAEAQEFQSTHPARGATLHRRYPRHVKEISIHAPREGCDISRRSVADDKQNFNPRTPRGVRQLLSCLQNSLPRRFQSTHPARGATLGEQQGCPSMRFQSTHPARGATSKVDLVFQQAKISIHAPREGCDLG